MVHCNTVYFTIHRIEDLDSSLETLRSAMERIESELKSEKSARQVSACLYLCVVVASLWCLLCRPYRTK